MDKASDCEVWGHGFNSNSVMKYGFMDKASDCEVWGHGFNSHSVMKFFLKFMLLEMIYLL